MSKFSVLLIGLVGVFVHAEGLCPVQTDADSLSVYIPHETDCQKFYECSSGQPELFECPAGLFFDVNLRICNWNAVCIIDIVAPADEFGSPSLDFIAPILLGEKPAPVDESDPPSVNDSGLKDDSPPAEEDDSKNVEFVLPPLEVVREPVDEIDAPSAEEDDSKSFEFIAPPFGGNNVPVNEENESVVVIDLNEINSAPVQSSDEEKAVPAEEYEEVSPDEILPIDEGVKKSIIF